MKYVQIKNEKVVTIFSASKPLKNGIVMQKSVMMTQGIYHIWNGLIAYSIFRKKGALRALC
ncbi:hypothetical protein [Dickeya dadantii]|uniref:hypothetical protein n=1 Tax=Dickeya dadantii TaxID=204038 RepID=UPI0021D8F47D|nr:hypothetical protein [Dickeya dadantii]